MITFEEFRRSVQEVVDRAEAEHGKDFRYQRVEESIPSNLPDGVNPYGCLVGAALTNMGYTIPLHLAFTAVRDLLATRGRFPATADVVLWAAVAQAWQDWEVPWRVAVRRADQTLVGP